MKWDWKVFIPYCAFYYIGHGSSPPKMVLSPFIPKSAEGADIFPLTILE